MINQWDKSKKPQNSLIPYFLEDLGVLGFLD